MGQLFCIAFCSVQSVQYSVQSVQYSVQSVQYSVIILNLESVQTSKSGLKHVYCKL